jgi:hypothetical protein
LEKKETKKEAIHKVVFTTKLLLSPNSISLAAAALAARRRRREPRVFGVQIRHLAGDAAVQI